MRPAVGLGRSGAPHRGSDHGLWVGLSSELVKTPLSSSPWGPQGRAPGLSPAWERAGPCAVLSTLLSPASHTQLVPQRPRPVAPELITKPATAAPATSTCPPGPCVILTVTLWGWYLRCSHGADGAEGWSSRRLAVGSLLCPGGHTGSPLLGRSHQRAAEQERQQKETQA